MVTLNGLAKFSGNEDEDASQWLDSFVVATNSCNNEAALRMFPTYLESAAREWFDDLPDDAIANWNSFRRQFRQKWIVGARAKKVNDAQVEKFQDHWLRGDDIFGPTSVDVAAMNKVVVDWVEDHVRLGAATGLDDKTLIQITLPHIPAFLRAFVRYKLAPPTTFQMLCQRVKEITDEILEFEQLCHQEKNIEWMSEVLEIVKKSCATTNNPSQGVDSNQGKSGTTDTETGAEQDDNASLPTAEKWKKTKILFDKAGMDSLVNEAITSLQKYGPSEITFNVACMIDIGLLRYYDAIKASINFQLSTIIRQAGAKSIVWEGLYQIHCRRTLNGSDDVTEAVRAWESISNNSTGTITKECIYKPHHTGWYNSANSQYSSSSISSNCIPLAGGLAEFGRGDAKTTPIFGANSLKTTLYFLLSLYLAERVSVGKDPYQQAAIDSVNWVMKWAYDENTNLVKWFVANMWSSSVYPSFFSPHVTGLFIEGLCVLASVTGEQKWTDLAVKMCYAAMAYPDWHDNEGIFNYVSSSGISTEDEMKAFRGLYVRGLSVAYQRNPTDQELRQAIRNYINAQFNAVRDYAYYRGSYAVNWTEPFVLGGSCVHGQATALDLLMAVVIVNYC